MAMQASDNGKRSTEHPIDRPPDTDPQEGHEHPEADPPLSDNAADPLAPDGAPQTPV